MPGSTIPTNFSPKVNIGGPKGGQFAPANGTPLKLPPGLNGTAGTQANGARQFVAKQTQQSTPIPTSMPAPNVNPVVPGAGSGSAANPVKAGTNVVRAARTAIGQFFNRKP